MRKSKYFITFLLVSYFALMFIVRENDYKIVDVKTFKEKINNSNGWWVYTQDSKLENQYHHFSLFVPTKDDERNWYLFLNIIGLKDSFKTKTVDKVKLNSELIDVIKTDEDQIKVLGHKIIYK